MARRISQHSQTFSKKPKPHVLRQLQEDCVSLAMWRCGGNQNLFRGPLLQQALYEVASGFVLAEIYHMSPHILQDIKLAKLAASLPESCAVQLE